MMFFKPSLLHEPHRKRTPWVVRFYTEPDPQTGKQKRRGRSFEHVRDAKAFMAEQVETLRNGRPDRINEQITLAELLTEFEDARLTGLSHASKVGYGNTTKQLLEYFGKAMRIADFQQRHAESFLASRKRVDGREGDLAGWSKARHLIHCRAIFQTAVEWEYLEKNPFRIGKYSGSTALRVKPKSRGWHHLTPVEFQRILSQVTSVQHRAALWLMYGCGLRAGEAYNLTTANVDLARRRIHVANRAASADIPPFVVKADGQSTEGKERRVPIPEAAIADLANAMRLAFRAGGFLVLSPERFKRVQEHWRLCRAKAGWAGHKWRPWQNRDMMNNFLRDTKGCLRRAGVGLTGPFNLHTFRKSFAQNHANAGTPPSTLAKLLGHSNTRVTLQFYSQVTDSNERTAAEVMNRWFDEPALRQASV